VEKLRRIVNNGYWLWHSSIVTDANLFSLPDDY